MKRKREQYFVRCRNEFTGTIYLGTRTGLHVFTVKGFRFFYENGVITDCITGQKVTTKTKWGDGRRKQIIREAKDKVSKNWDTYFEKIKRYLRENRTTIIRRELP